MSNTTSVETVKAEISRNPMLYLMFFVMMGGQTGDLFTSNNVAIEIRELRQDMERRMLAEEDATDQFKEKSVSGELKPGEELTIEGEGERIRGGATLRCWSTDEDRGLDVCVKAFELGPFCFPLPGKLVDAFCESPEDMPDDAGDAGDVPETDTIDGDIDASEGDTVTMLYWRKYRVV